MDRAVDKERRKAIKNSASFHDVFQSEGWGFEYQFLEEDEASFHTRRLLGRARKLRLLTPPFMRDDSISPDYRRSATDPNRFFLSLEGEHKVRTAIREEEKYRSERWARRIPYITALSGLIGTITGLVALLLHWGTK